MSRDLNPAKALIFRIIHRNNMPWVIEHGLHCKNSKSKDPNFVSIGNPDLIDKRSHRNVPCPPGGTLSDYVPFYFTPFSPMMLNIKTGRGVRKRSNDEVVILVSSLHSLKKRSVPFVFTDRHAYLAAARFTSDLDRLDWIDWPLLQRRDFKRDDDVVKLERYQAEALVHGHLPVGALSGIVCYNDSVAAALLASAKKQNLNVPVLTKPSWYF